MPAIRTLVNVALGLSPGPTRRTAARFQQPTMTMRYGEHELQALDFFSAGDGVRPLVVFIHGGAWQFGDKARRPGDRKAAFVRAQGWHFAALNFCLVPQVGVTDMALDIARAVGVLLTKAPRLGIDTAAVVLMGHSSGAHLACLVGTCPRYLGQLGYAPDVLAGVIAVDGAAYDPAARSTGAVWLERRLIHPAFPPADPDGLALVSPVRQAVSPPNARGFLLLHAGNTQRSEQARRMEAALRTARTPVRRIGHGGGGVAAHVALSRRFGSDGHEPTQAVRAWLRELLAHTQAPS